MNATMKPLKWRGDAYEATSEVRNGHYALAYSSGYWAVVRAFDDRTIHYNSKRRTFAEAKRAAGNFLNEIHTKEWAMTEKQIQAGLKRFVTANAVLRLAGEKYHKMETNFRRELHEFEKRVKEAMVPKLIGRTATPSRNRPRIKIGGIYVDVPSYGDFDKVNIKVSGYPINRKGEVIVGRSQQSYRIEDVELSPVEKVKP